MLSWSALRTLPIGPTIAVVAIISAYLIGRNDGRNIIRGQYAAAARAAVNMRDAKQAEINAIAERFEAREATRQAEIKTIIREVPHVIKSDPVHIERCLSDDSVQLINRAIAANNNPGSVTRTMP